MHLEKDDRRNISEHIVSTSGNLPGLCFAILSFINVAGPTSKAIIDDMMLPSVILFMFSAFFLYASMRSLQRRENYERIADIIFIAGLFLLTFCAVTAGVSLLH